MQFNETPLKGAYVVHFDPHTDVRGSFVRMFCKKEFSAIGFDMEITQVNFSRTEEKHTIRGLHYRKSEGDECKMLSCLHGKIYDVIVDLRRDSPTFLGHFSIELSGGDNKMLFMPKGFAHGFQSLEPESEIIYFHTGYYDPAHDMGLRHDDPALEIKWPFAPAYLSPRDSSHPLIDRTFSGI